LRSTRRRRWGGACVGRKDDSESKVDSLTSGGLGGPVISLSILNVGASICTSLPSPLIGDSALQIYPRFLLCPTPSLAMASGFLSYILFFPHFVPRPIHHASCPKDPEMISKISRMWFPRFIQRGFYAWRVFLPAGPKCPPSPCNWSTVSRARLVVYCSIIGLKNS